MVACLQMLTLQLNGQRFTKTIRIHDTLRRLNGSSKASAEYKFRNISAVMDELGWPAVTGYKSPPNYPYVLLEVAGSQLQPNAALQDAA
ncbi:MAG: hypothetical protein ABIU96_14280 [Rhodanobacter sp.]